MRAGSSNRGKNGGFRRFLRAPVICAALVVASAFAAPTMVRAFSGDSLPISLAARGALGSFTPASIDPRLITQGITQGAIHALAHGRLFRFTPAGMDNRPDRAVTVAVRVTGTHNAMFATHTASADGAAGFAAVRITPVAYNLGLARGYQSFGLPTAGVIHDLPHDNGELRAFSLAATPGATSSAGAPRLAADVAFDDIATPGRAPRTLGTQGDYQVKMGGSLHVVGNLDVTAGLRYSSDRDRLGALTDHRQDSQAIYVGTKFRF